MLGDLQIDEIRPDRLEARKRALLVDADQARIAGHIRRENSGEPAFHSGLLHGALPPRPRSYTRRPPIRIAGDAGG
jgi:hypothetical protein